MPKTKLEKSMALLAFLPEDAFSRLDENEKKEFVAWCSSMFKNKFFNNLFNELYTKEVLETIGKLENHDSAVEGRGIVFGIAGVKDMFQNYHLQHLENIRKDAPMTEEERQEVI